MQTPASTPDVNEQKSKPQINKTYENLHSLHHKTQTQNLPTPVNHAALSTLLDEYNGREFTINGFGCKNEFSIGYKGTDKQLYSNNAYSVQQNSDIIRDKLKGELYHSRIEEPLQTIPFINFKSSPLALHEKKESGKFRLTLLIILIR